MVTKKNQVTLYLSDEVRDRIKVIADKERRSFSFTAEELLIEALEIREKSSGKKD